MEHVKSLKNALESINATESYIEFRRFGFKTLDDIKVCDDAEEIKEIGKLNSLEQAKKLLKIAQNPLQDNKQIKIHTKTVNEPKKDNSNQITKSEPKEIKISNNESIIKNSDNVCPKCNHVINSMLFDRHIIHCKETVNSNNINEQKQKKDIKMKPKMVENENKNDSNNVDTINIDITNINDNNNNNNEEIIINNNSETLECSYCFDTIKIDNLFAHEEYCSSRTEKCNICLKRETLYNLRQHKHMCSKEDIDSLILSFQTNPNINDLDLIGPFEAKLHQIRSILYKKTEFDNNYHYANTVFNGHSKPMHTILKEQTENYHHRNNILKNRKKLTKTYKTLQTIVCNIIKFPNDNKKRKLNYSNKTLKNHIFDIPPALEFLKLVGFGHNSNTNKFQLSTENINLLKLFIAKQLLRVALETFINILNDDKKEETVWNDQVAFSKSEVLPNCWTCKKCSKLNRGSSYKCSDCHTRRARPRKIVKSEEELNKIDQRRWKCTFCSCRTSVTFDKCDNCKKIRQIDDNNNNENENKNNDYYYKISSDRFNEKYDKFVENEYVYGVEQE